MIKNNYKITIELNNISFTKNEITDIIYSMYMDKIKNNNIKIQSSLIEIKQLEVEKCTM